MITMTTMTMVGVQVIEKIQMRSYQTFIVIKHEVNEVWMRFRELTPGPALIIMRSAPEVKIWA